VRRQPQAQQPQVLNAQMNRGGLYDNHTSRLNPLQYSAPATTTTPIAIESEGEGEGEGEGFGKYYYLPPHEVGRSSANTIF